MLSRRIFAACGLCSAIGLVASAVEAGAQPAPAGSVTRTVLGTIDYPGDGKVSILMTIEVPPNAAIARHTHPGVEFLGGDGGRDGAGGAGPAHHTIKAGEGFQVPPGVPHAGRNGPQRARIAATYIVRRTSHWPRGPEPIALQRRLRISA